jgi:transketolase
MLSVIPNVAIFAPVTTEGVAASLRAALARGGVCAVRYPNGTEQQAIKNAFYPNGITAEDTPRVRVFGGDDARVTVVTHGRITAEALAAAEQLAGEGVSVRVLLCEYLAPYDTLAAELAPLLRGAVIFLEEEVRAGGFGMNLSDALTRRGALRAPFAILAADNGFLSPVAGDNYYAAAGIDAEAVVSAAKKLLDDKGETKC